MIPPNVKKFSLDAIAEVTGDSRTTLWREGLMGRLGQDVLDYIRRRRAANGSPPLSPGAERDVLAGLVAVEDARRATMIDKARDRADMMADDNQDAA